MVWVVVTAATTALLTLAADDVRAARRWPAVPASFDTMLSCAATLVAAACALWFWWTTTAVLTATWRGAAPGSGTARRIVAMACGFAVAAGAAPAHAEERAAVAGMPPQPLTAPVGDTFRTTTDSLTVLPGDTLWSLSREALTARHRPATDADVSRTWRALWHANHATIADPDLIEPGQRLVLPEALR